MINQPSVEPFAGGRTVEITYVDFVNIVRRAPNNVDVAQTSHHVGGDQPVVRRWVRDLDERVPAWRSYPDGAPASQSISDLIEWWLRRNPA